MAITMAGIRKVFGKLQVPSDEAPTILKVVKYPEVAPAQKTALKIRY